MCTLTYLMCIFRNVYVNFYIQTLQRGQLSQSNTNILTRHSLLQNFQRKKLKSGKNIYIFFFLSQLIIACKTDTQFCGCTCLKIQYDLFNKTGDLTWPVLELAEQFIDLPHFSPLPMSDSFKHSYLTFRCLTKDK